MAYTNHQQFWVLFMSTHCKILVYVYSMDKYLKILPPFQLLAQLSTLH